MVRRTDEYQSSLEDLANAHRAAEDGRLNALQELESRKYELADLKVKKKNNSFYFYIKVNNAIFMSIYFKYF